MVLRSEKPHLLQIQIRHQRQINKLVVAEGGLLGNLRAKLLRFADQTVALSNQTVAFTESEGRVYASVHGLRPSRAGNLRISAKEFRHLRALIAVGKPREMLLRKILRIIDRAMQVARSVAVEIIGEVEEVRERILVTEDIADVYDPKLADAVIVGGRHLLPYLRKEGGVVPLKGNRIAVVIEMIIHSVAALVAAHLGRRQRAEVSVVVVAEHQRNALKLGIPHQAGRRLVAVEIRLHLFIKGKHSRNLIEILVHMLFDQSVLRFKNAPQQVYVVGKRRLPAENSRIRFAAHADRDDIFKLSASLKAVLPEAGDAFFVRVEVPGVAVHGILAAHIAVLFALAAARLMMGSTHDNTEFIREDCVLKSRTVVREDCRPHGGPQVVALQAEQQFKYMRVHLCVEAAVILRAEIAEGRPFVVDKETAETDRRLLRNKTKTFFQCKAVKLCGLHIKPVDKGRYAEHLGQMEQPVDGSALLASRDHQQLCKIPLRSVHEKLLRNIT